MRFENAMILGIRSLILQNANRPAAVQALQECLALLDSCGQLWLLAYLQVQAASVAAELGQPEPARQMIERSLDIFQSLGDRFNTGRCLERMAQLAWVQGRIEESETLIRQASEIAQEWDNQLTIAYHKHRLGEILKRAGKFTEGLPVLEDSIEQLTRLGQLGWVYPSKHLMAEALVHLGRIDEATTWNCCDSSWQWSIGFKEFVDGLIELGKGHPEEASTHLETSAATFQRLGHRENLGWAQAVQSYACRLQGRTAEARQQLCTALRITQDTTTIFALIYALPAAALLLVDQGNLELARRAACLGWRYGFIANSAWFKSLAGDLLSLRLGEFSSPDAPTPTPAEAMAIIPELLEALK